MDIAAFPVPNRAVTAEEMRIMYRLKKKTVLPDANLIDKLQCEPDCMLVLNPAMDANTVDFHKAPIYHQGTDKYKSYPRFIYELYHGQLSVEKRIFHLCSQARCVNPYHLTANNKGRKLHASKHKIATKEEPIFSDQAFSHEKWIDTSIGLRRAARQSDSNE